MRLQKGDLGEESEECCRLALIPSCVTGRGTILAARLLLWEVLPEIPWPCA